MNLRHIACLILIGVLCVYCTRKAERSSAKVRLELPSQGKSASALSTVLSRLMLNISRPGMATIVVIRDDDNTGSGVSPILEVELPSGANTLIQVLAVYDDPVTGGMEFLYNDVNVTLASGDNDVPIQLESLNSSSGVQGRVVGRYALPGPVYPTAFVEMTYDPGAGKPKFVIGDSQMVGGWFNFFLLDDIRFAYRFKHNKAPIAFTTDLVAGQRVQRESVQLSDFNDVTYSAGVFPGIGIVDLSAQTSMYRTHTTSGPGTFEKVDPFKVVYGFHGSDDLPWIGLYVRFNDSLSSNFSKMKSFAEDSGDGDCASVEMGQSFDVTNVIPSPGPPATVLFDGAYPCTVNVTSVPYMSSLAGGVTFSPPMTASWTTDYLEVDRSFIDGQGNDNLAPFLGGFRKIWVSSGGYFNPVGTQTHSSCSAGCTTNFAMELVSKADEAYAAIRVYQAATKSEEDVRSNEDNVDCAKFANDPDFTLVGATPVSLGTTSYSTPDITFAAGESTSDYAIALCPVDASGKFAPGALLLGTSRFFSGSPP